MKTKPFNLEEAKAGKPVVTRDGHCVRILAFDLRNTIYPICCVWRYDDADSPPDVWTSRGNFKVSGEDPKDLLMLVETKQYWINIYRNKDGIHVHHYAGLYPTKEIAISKATPSWDRVDTVFVYEEEV